MPIVKKTDTKHQSGRRRKRLRALRNVAALPAMLTVGNLLCGAASIFYASRMAGSEHVMNHWSTLYLAAALIFIGMVFDAIDGRVARLTHQTSQFGAQLDSMADMVTFGLAPAFVMIQLVNIGSPFIDTLSARWNTFFDRAVLMVAGIYVACTALRLARYNVEAMASEAEAHNYFRGLPSPGAAGTVAGLVLMHQELISHDVWPWVTTSTAVALVIVTLITAMAMVSPLRWIHLPNRYLRGRVPFYYVAFVFVLGPLLLIYPEYSLAAGFVLYSMSGVVWGLFRRKGVRARPVDAGPDGDQDRSRLHGSNGNQE